MDYLWHGADLMGVAQQILAAGGGGETLTFVGASTISGASSGNISYPAGTAVGDICIVSLCGSPFFGGSGTWTTAINGNGSMAGVSTLYVYTRILQSGDISSPPSFANATGALGVLVWRGGTAISLKTGPTTGSGSNLTLTGFVKDAACKGIIIAGYDRADSIGVTTVPSPFIKRNEQRGSYHQMTFADCASPGSYTNSSSISWTGWNTTYNSNVGAVFEVT